MTRSIRSVITNFSSGELNPLLATRTDVSSYFQGAKSCRNFALLAEGGLMRRPGTTYLATLPAECRLIPFIFSDDEVAIIALSNGRMDVYNVAGTVLTSNYTTNCNWTTAQLFQLNFAQFGDTVFVTHRNNAIRKIFRSSATVFTVLTFAFDAHSSGYPIYQPYYKYADTTTTIGTSGTTGSVTVTASADTFTAAWIGLKIRKSDAAGANYKTMTITGYTSATQVTATCNETLTNTTATTEWDEQTISSLRGYPQAVTFHHNRLWLGGVLSRPASVMASKSSEYTNFDLGTSLASEAIDLDIAGDQVNEVRHMLSAKDLLIFTDGGEYYVPVSSNNTITPSNILVQRQTPYGIARTAPQMFDQAAGFVQKSGKSIREFIYSDIEDGYKSSSVSILAQHLIDSPKEIAILKGNLTRPEQYAFFLNNGSTHAGKLSVFHSVRDEKIAGWTLWNTRSSDLYQSLITLNENLIACTKRVINSSAATCTITVTDYSNIATGATLVLTKNDGTTVTFTSTTGTAGTDEFKTETNNNTTADNIYTCINTHADFSAANPAANVVTVTRAANGGDNLTVTSSDDTRLAVTDFTGGTTTAYTLEKFGEEDTTTLDCQTTSTLNQRGTPLVKGASQTGTSLIMDGVTSAPVINEQFTIAGHTAEYTIVSSVFSSGTTYTLVLDKTLAATPADNAAITFTKGFLHTVNAIYATDTVNAVEGYSSLGAFTVGSNTITLLNAPRATGLKIGFNYIPSVETMPIDKELPDGPITGLPRRISKAIIDMNTTLDMTVKAADTTAKNLVVQQVSDTVGADLVPITSKKEFHFLGYDKNPTITISQDDPLPMKLLGMAVEIIFV